MATPIVTPVAEPELRIEIVQDWCVWFIGTAAQLQAEGLIPEGLEWPTAKAHRSWQANGSDFWLHRVRPEGHKGPMRSWLGLDSWRLQMRASDWDHSKRVARELRRKAEELRAECHRYTDEGGREWNARWTRYWAAQNDDAFQAFKARVPGLIPTKRGRRAKAA